MVFHPFHFHDCVNRLSSALLDPYSRQPAFKSSGAVRIEPVATDDGGPAQRRRCAAFRSEMPMFDVREKTKPDYARLHDPEAHTHNRYGSLIDLVERSQLPAGESMQINGDLRRPARIRNATSSTASTSRRTIAIGCHGPVRRPAPEKKTTCRRISRSARWICRIRHANTEFHAHQYLHACNPTATTRVCSKAAPPCAYTKFTEYGAVLQIRTSVSAAATALGVPPKPPSFDP